MTSDEALREIMADDDSNDEDFSDLEVSDDFSVVSQLAFFMLFTSNSSFM